MQTVRRWALGAAVITSVMENVLFQVDSLVSIIIGIAWLAFPEWLLHRQVFISPSNINFRQLSGWEIRTFAHIPSIFFFYMNIFHWSFILIASKFQKNKTKLCSTFWMENHQHFLAENPNSCKTYFEMLCSWKISAFKRLFTLLYKYYARTWYVSTIFFQKLPSNATLVSKFQHC